MEQVQSVEKVEKQEEEKVIVKMTEEIRENIKFDFIPEFKIVESKNSNSKWIQLGGVALAEGISENKNHYTKINLEENDNKEFKWLFGHPDLPESHVIGSGKVFMEGDLLMHEGKLRNTVTHPDVIESVRDGFLGPSIHASAKKVTRKEGEYFVEGLSIDGIGLVAFQGVKQASIDYAIAESFDMKESDSNTGADANNKNKEADNMSEETKDQPAEAPTEEAPQEEPQKEQPETKEEPEVKEEPKEEEVKDEAVEALKKEVAELKEARKKDLVESIISINKTLKAEELMKESDEKLDTIKQYEEKIAGKSSSAVVETEEKVTSQLEEKDGKVSMSSAMYENFNKEIKERVR